MLRLVNVGLRSKSIYLNDIVFEDGISYGIDSVNMNVNMTLRDLLFGYLIPDEGSIYVTLGGVTNNLLTVNDDYLYNYNKLCVYMERGGSLVPDLSIMDNMLLLARSYRGVKGVNMRKLLKMVHIDDVSKKVDYLSDSDKYRVNLAQVLHMRPKLVICNDLFSGVEDMELESLLIDVCKHVGATLIYMGKIVDNSNYDVLIDYQSMLGL